MPGRSIRSTSYIEFDVQKRSTAKLITDSEANLIAKFLAQVNRARTYSLMICALTKNTFTSEYNLCSDTDYQICTGAVIIGVTRGSVYFLTNGGTQIYVDVRRNSLEEAKKVALEGGLDGIVSEVKGIFRNPSAVREIKESNLFLLTYGKLNNFPETVQMSNHPSWDRDGVDCVDIGREEPFSSGA
ncbi:hypothetical protein Tco_0612243 [Tanacetum coccineum]